MPAFPAIAILPNSETIISRQSNGRQLVQRSVSLEVFSSKNAKVENAVAEVQDIMSAIKDIGQVQISGMWGSSCFDFTMSEEFYQRPYFTTKNLIIQSGIMPFTFLDEQIVPVADVKIAPSVKEVNSKTLIEFIYDVIKGYKDSTTYDLSDVNVFSEFTIPLIPQFPAISIVEGRLLRSRTYTGMDEPTREFDISVYTQLIDKENSLDKNLDIVEVLKDILEIEHQWIDSSDSVAQATTSKMKTIYYNRENIRALGKVYRSAIQYDVYGLEPLV